jgi:hypothetical protein
VLHLVPISSFAEKKAYDVRLAREGPTTLVPMYASSYSLRYNLDGLLSYVGPRGSTPTYMYTQLYSDGRIEAVDASWIQASGDKNALGKGFEKFIVDATKMYLATQEALGVGAPILAMLTFLAVRGYVIGGTDSWYARHGEDGIDRDDLVLSEIVIEELACAIEQCMRPAFDAVWMACGWPGSMNYDDEGNWRPSF